MLNDVDYSSHKQMGVFYRQFYIKTEIFDKEMSKVLTDASNVRESSDYDIEFSIGVQGLADLIGRVDLSIKTIQNYINKQLS